MVSALKTHPTGFLRGEINTKTTRISEIPPEFGPFNLALPQGVRRVGRVWRHPLARRGLKEGGNHGGFWIWIVRIKYEKNKKKYIYDFLGAEGAVGFLTARSETSWWCSLARPSVLTVQPSSENLQNRAQKGKFRPLLYVYTVKY